MDVMEARLAFLKDDPTFGRSCLDFFDSLGLTDVYVPRGAGANHASIMLTGTKTIRERTDSLSLTEMRYCVGFYNQHSCCFGVEFGRPFIRGEYSVFLTEKDGDINCSMPVPLDVLERSGAYIPKSRRSDDAFFSQAVAEARTTLGIN